MIDPGSYVMVGVPYITAFLAGLFGSLHCLGMCGGINSALTLHCANHDSVLRNSWKITGFHIGRLMTYALLGGVVGLVGVQGGQLIEQYQGWMWLRVLAGLLMIAMGLYLAAWWQGLIKLEQLGGSLVWRHLQPVNQRLLSASGARQPLLLGMTWGLLPCGLIYSMLVWSLASGGVYEGALLLLSFGLGTLPMMLATSVLSLKSRDWLQQRIVRQTAGLVVISFGVWTIAASLLGQINVGLGCLPPA